MRECKLLDFTPQATEMDKFTDSPTQPPVSSPFSVYKKHPHSPLNFAIQIRIKKN